MRSNFRKKFYGSTPQSIMLKVTVLVLERKFEVIADSLFPNSWFLSMILKKLIEESSSDDFPYLDSIINRSTKEKLVLSDEIGEHIKAGHHIELYSSLLKPSSNPSDFWIGDIKYLLNSQREIEVLIWRQLIDITLGQENKNVIIQEKCVFNCILPGSIISFINGKDAKGKGLSKVTQMMKNRPITITFLVPEEKKLNQLKQKEKLEIKENILKEITKQENRQKEEEEKKEKQKRFEEEKLNEEQKKRFEDEQLLYEKMIRKREEQQKQQLIRRKSSLDRMFDKEALQDETKPQVESQSINSERNQNQEQDFEYRSEDRREDRKEDRKEGRKEDRKEDTKEDRKEERKKSLIGNSHHFAAKSLNLKRSDTSEETPEKRIISTLDQLYEQLRENDRKRKEIVHRIELYQKRLEVLHPQKAKQYQKEAPSTQDNFLIESLKRAGFAVSSLSCKPPVASEASSRRSFRTDNQRTNNKKSQITSSASVSSVKSVDRRRLNEKNSFSRDSWITSSHDCPGVGSYNVGLDSTLNKRGGILPKHSTQRDTWIKRSNVPGVGSYAVEKLVKIKGGDIGDTPRYLTDNI